MIQLKVLKLDHNPLEWPPKEVTMFPASGSLSGSLVGGTGTNGENERRGSSKVEEAEEMSRWLPDLLRWIRDNGGELKSCVCFLVYCTDPNLY